MAPESYTELLDLVKEQTQKLKEDSKVLQIYYADDAGGEFAVHDFEDLSAAFKWASTQPNSYIKLSVVNKNEVISDV